MKQEMMLGGPAVRLNKEEEISLDVKPYLLDPHQGFDRKLDGTRMIAVKEVGQPVILYGRGSRKISETERMQTIYNKQFPELVQAFNKLAMEIGTFRIDGEAIVMGNNGFEDFKLVQKRTTRKYDIEDIAKQYPAIFMAFDTMVLSSSDLSNEPLHTRHHWLEEALKSEDLENIKVLPLFTKTKDKRELVEMCIRETLEGVMIKDMNAPYVYGRAKSWIKAKRTFTEDVFPLSYTPGTGRREPWFGALKCYYWKDGAPEYATNVGGGLDDSDLTFFKNLLKDVNPTDSPEEIFKVLKSMDKLIVMEIEHYGIQKAGRRHPNMLRIRNDKDAEQCDGESR